MAKRSNKNSRSDSKNYLKMWDMFGVPMFGRDRNDLLKIVGSYAGEGPIWIATVNPEFVMNALKDWEFMKILQKNTTFNVADGVGLAWAREVLKVKEDILINRVVRRLATGLMVGIRVLSGKYKDELISGADLIDSLCEEAQRCGRRVFFLGGWGDRGVRTAKYFKKRYPKLLVAGSYAGNRVGEDDKTLRVLHEKQIDYLFVAYAMKTQEEWISRNIDKLNVKLVMGVGRTFDYYSGDLKRAPVWVRRMGFEWLFSLIKEPSRWKRQLALPRFIVKTLTTT